MRDPFTPKTPNETDPDVEIRRGQRILDFRDVVAQAEDCQPIVLCLVAVGRNGSVHSVITMPDTKSFQAFEAAGRLQAMATEIAAIATRSEGVNVLPGPNTTDLGDGS